MKEYDWAIIGGGITGVVLSEILIREGHSVILIEKNQKLACETTRDFHEWLHTGALYTLIPDKLRTLKFILGAVDDLLEYYSCYERMNLNPTMTGMKIESMEEGWFESNYIDFKFRLKNRKIVFPWLIGVARSMFLIEKIHQHDWLRRRAGELEPFKQDRIKKISSFILQLVKSKQKFKTVKTPDFTINSRALMRDILTTAITKGLVLSMNNAIHNIKSSDKLKIISGTKGNIHAKKVAVCAGAGIKDFSKVGITTSYAPIAVVSGVPKSAKSFVELDYYPKNCINLLTKKKGMGLVGGISFKNKAKCDKYLDTVVKKQQLLFPEMKEVDRYVGIKSEITFEDQPRSYLYHIVEIEKDMWSVIPGKFTLAFSLAPEFYRRVYLKNPRKFFQTYTDNKKYSDKVANTVWFDSMKRQ